MSRVENGRVSIPSARYLGADFLRLLSYRYQLVYATRNSHSSVLVIGKGDGLVPGFLRSLGANVLIADINPHLAPGRHQRRASAVAGRRRSRREHLLPGARASAVRPVQSRARRAASGDAVAPDTEPSRRAAALATMRLEAGRFVLDRPGSLPAFRAQPFPTTSRAKIGHHWEIGFRGFPFTAVRSDIQSAGWEIVERARVHEFPWHTFFYCKAV